MSIPADAKHRPLDRPQVHFPAVDPHTGLFTPQEIDRQERARAYVTGAGRIIPCSASTSSNLITLTPNGHGDEDGDAPLVEGYRFGDIYLFVADASSTGAVTAQVALKKPTDSSPVPMLDALKVYITGGAAQAGNGDITAGLVYLGVYAYNLDSNAGGIVIRHP